MWDAHKNTGRTKDALSQGDYYAGTVLGSASLAMAQTGGATPSVMDALRMRKVPIVPAWLS
jgi:hypothetical protein